MAFTRTWDVPYEANPDGGQAASQGDDRIRELKTDTRERGNLEHDWGTVGGATDTGRHKFPTGDKATRDAIADLIANGQIFLRTDRAGLDHRLAAAWVQRYFYDVLTTALRTALTNVDKGYLVYDTDLDQWLYGDGAGGWLHQGGKIDIQVTAATNADESPGASDTWTDITGLSKAVAVPNDGVDYLIVAIGIVKATGPVDVNAFRLMEDATERDVSVFTVEGAGNPRSTIVVGHVKTDPVNNTTYTFKVQMLTKGTAANLDVNPTITLAAASTVLYSKLITVLIRKAV